MSFRVHERDNWVLYMVTRFHKGSSWVPEGTWGTWNGHCSPRVRFLYPLDWDLSHSDKVIWVHDEFGKRDNLTVKHYLGILMNIYVVYMLVLCYVKCLKMWMVYIWLIPTKRNMNLKYVCYIYIYYMHLCVKRKPTAFSLQGILNGDNSVQND